MGIIVDTSQLTNFSAKIKALDKVGREMFFRQCCTEGANRLIALVKPMTPVKTGVLRSGWDNALSGLTAENVTKSQGVGNSTYSVTVVNAVPYASYVEHGHRQTPGRYVPAIGKRLVASWVNGTHMLETSEANLNTILPSVIQTKLDAMLRTVF